METKRLCCLWQIKSDCGTGPAASRGRQQRQEMGGRGPQTADWEALGGCSGRTRKVRTYLPPSQGPTPTLESFLPGAGITFQFPTPLSSENTDPMCTIWRDGEEDGYCEHDEEGGGRELDQPVQHRTAGISSAL